MRMNSVRLTADGRKRLESELHESQERLIEVEEAIRQMLLCKCDLEQLTLMEARERKASLEGEVNELESTLNRAITLPQARRSSVVDLGAFVALRNEETGEETTVQVVAGAEATVTKGEVVRISDSSPVGTRVLGRTVGDVIELPSGRGGEVRYEVTSFRY